MKIYYSLLGIDSSASIAEIKRAFRKKVKSLHPDTSKERSIHINKKMTQLLEAYKALLKEKENISDILGFNHFYNQKIHKEFNYREWLLERTDTESKTKLILFDLFHDYENNAIEQYLELKRTSFDYNLFRYLEREEFMDCGFVLAEELFFRNKYYEAFELLYEVILLEYEKPYFKHFFPEVEKLCRIILIEKIYKIENYEDIIECYASALNMKFSKNDQARFAKHLAQAYHELGDEFIANSYMEKAISLMPRIRRPI